MIALQDRIGLTNEKNGWHDEYLNTWPESPERRDHIITKVMLAVTELAEAVEELRNGHPETEVYFNGTKPEGFPVEIADTVIRLYDLAYMIGFDLDSEIERKLAFNATRTFKHGGKTV